MTHRTEPLDVSDLGFQEALTAELERAAAARSVLIALDFDGTLAHFTEDIAASRATPVAERALQELAGMENTWVGVVSGRTMDFLHDAVDPERRMLLSGSHGAEYDLSVLGADAASSGVELSAEQSRLLERAKAATTAMVQRYPGATAELKPAGAAFHTRTMHRLEDSAQALEAMLAEYTALEGLRVTPGDMVMECSVLTTDKGQAVEALINAVNPDVAIFAGDDVTDEHGLKVLRETDLGIKVGPKETVAPFRVADPDAMGEVLAQLARLRAHRAG